jgi:hypothetical protein
MGVWKPWESRHEDLAGEGREAVELPEMQPPEAATMRRAAVFVDAKRNASCVPRDGVEKTA